MIDLFKIRVKDNEIQRILHNLSKWRCVEVDNLTARKLGQRLQYVRDLKKVYIANDRKNRSSIVSLAPLVEIKLDKKGFFVFKTRI